MKPNSAPESLSKNSAELWRALTTEFVLDDTGSRLLLEQTLSALDRAEEARAAIDKDGACVRDRFDQIQKHPMIGVERDCRAQVLQGLRALNLDPGTLAKPRLGRPPGKARA